MALFPSNKISQTRPYRRKQFHPATDLSKLHILCRPNAIHPLPVKMRFDSMSRSDKGDAMGIYVCEFPGCTCQQGWVRHHQTRRPLRLWHRSNSNK